MPFYRHIALLLAPITCRKVKLSQIVLLCACGGSNIMFNGSFFTPYNCCLQSIGEITSGAFSPCLKKNIAMGWEEWCDELRQSMTFELWCKRPSFSHHVPLCSLKKIVLKRTCRLLLISNVAFHVYVRFSPLPEPSQAFTTEVSWPKSMNCANHLKHVLLVSSSLPHGDVQAGLLCWGMHQSWQHTVTLRVLQPLNQAWNRMPLLSNNSMDTGGS